MADIQHIIPHIIKWEGGFANHPKDKGGPTNKGVTLDTYKLWCRRRGRRVPTVEDLKRISDSDWLSILKEFYWDRWRADSINNQSIANLLVDWLFNSGRYGIKYPQQVLHVVDDCVVGPKTIQAINNHPNQRELFDLLWKRRMKQFEGIISKNPSQKVFFRGWMNRLEDLKFEEED